MDEIFILGAGTYSEVMIDLAFECGFLPTEIFDDDTSKIGGSILGIPIKNTINYLFSHEEIIHKKNFIVAIGNNKIRMELLERIRNLKGVTPCLIHPTSTISKFAEIGEGCYIQPHVVIWTKVKVLNDCIISPNVVIAHHSNVHRGCLISTGASVGANIDIFEGAFLGMSCNITTGIKYVGKNSVIGAGAVVITDVEENTVVAGVPAKTLKKR